MKKEILKKKRITSIDALRGLVILTMLLDHVRERFFLHVQVSDPMDIETTSPSLFFTRLSAHLCAPVFVFLTGLSAWLYANPKNKPYRSPSSFLLKRGLFLILLEITLVNLSWFGSYHTLYLQVIWAIGLSMICLSLLSKLPRHLILIIGLAIVFGHNALSFISFTKDEIGFIPWTILHDRGYLFNADWLSIKISYPVLPWIGVILLGFYCGPLYKHSIAAIKRQKLLLTLSACCIATLIILRTFNIYGETLPWATQSNTITTVMSFLNYTKYPPSLDFLLLTLSIGFALLYLFEKYEGKFTRILKTYGSAPMFFYILHLYVLLALYTLGVSIFGTNKGEYLGCNYIYEIWLIAIVLSVALYYPTKWFASYKHKSNSKLLKYF